MKFKFFILPLFVLTLLHTASYAQCGQSVTIKSEIDNSAETGSITIQVKSNDSFKCSLVIETVNENQILKEMTGSGNDKVLFSDLKVGVLYTIKISFPDEEILICRNFRKTVYLK